MGHAIVLGVLVVVWGPEATHASAPPAVEAAGECARCHEVETAAAVDHGGHAAELSCESCHSDRRPGRFGRRHRAKPRCTSHHDVTGHPPHAVRRTRRKPTANCLACHDPHGTANAAVVRPRVRTRGR